MPSEKSREQRLRRMADRQGSVLEKSRRRDKNARDFGLYTLYRVRGDQTEDQLTLDMVENILTKHR
jgi:hypothetical protein